MEATVRTRLHVHIHKRPGSYVHFCRVFASSTCRWPSLPPTGKKGLQSTRSPCSDAHFGRATAACHRQETGTCNRIWGICWVSSMYKRATSSRALLHLVRNKLPLKQKLTMASTWKVFVPKVCVRHVFYAPPCAVSEHYLWPQAHGHPTWANKDAHTRTGHLVIHLGYSRSLNQSN